VLYKTVVVLIMTYRSAIWYDRSEHVVIRRHLLAAKRVFLLALTGACRTVSTAALQVLGDVLPADLEVCQFAVTRKLKRNESVI